MHFFANSLRVFNNKKHENFSNFQGLHLHIGQLRILRQSTPRTMATGMHSHSTPGTFFSLSCRLYVYNQHTQQFARWFGDSHVTHIPTRTVRNVRCRIVYERSRQIRPLNSESGLATHPKGLRWSSYTPGGAKQSLKPAHVGFLQKWHFWLPSMYDFSILTLFLTCLYARAYARVYSK